MRGILKVKKNEEKNIKLRVKELLDEEHRLKSEIENINLKIFSLQKEDVKDITHLWLKTETIKSLIKLREKKIIELERLENRLKKEKEKLLIVRGEIKAIENFLQRKLKEEERIREVLNERLIYQAIYARTNS